MSERIKKVHVIYKTHLDLGFTDFAKNVVGNYIDNFIPKAVETAEKVNIAGEPKKFIWTTGSWIINEFLKQENKYNIKQMEDAIIRGSIKWHGLPFTTHSELMNQRIFEYGISISQKLDKRFGKQTIAAKMTDVPGHTRGIVSLLARNGIKYLHIGANPSSKVPDVPKAFLWKGKDQSEVIVNYSSSYGEPLELDVLDEVLVFAHTGDNMGPVEEKSIIENITVLQNKYPNAVVAASTLDDFAAVIWKYREFLPVVSEEIGDTWIHGIGTDPKKVSYYKELLRLCEKWVDEKRLIVGSEEYISFLNELILIPEHTWGMDLKKHFSDFKNYLKEDFEKARAQNVIKDSIPEKYSYIRQFAMNPECTSSDNMSGAEADTRTYSRFEQSWEEQRQYLYSAVSKLAADKQQEANKSFEELKPVYYVPEGRNLKINTVYKLGPFHAAFSKDGSINSLMDEKGIQYADEENRIGRFIYEVFDHEDYEYWLNNYQRDMKQHYSWCIADFGKPGLELAKVPVGHSEYYGSADRITLIELKDGCKAYVELTMPLECKQKYGAPERLLITYNFLKNGELYIELNWFNKDANRIPEASWLEISLCTNDASKWLMKKMGEYVSPYEVVSNGSRNLHAVEEIVYGSKGDIIIEPMDSPLVSIGNAKILKFDNRLPDISNSMYFNFHNNIWGTNFPMWFEEDMKYRFRIALNTRH